MTTTSNVFYAKVPTKLLPKTQTVRERERKRKN